MKMVWKDILGLTSQTINDNIDIIEACRLLNKLKYDVEEEYQYLFNYFSYVDSETEEYPEKSKRKLYSHNYLRRLDNEFKLYINNIKGDVINACKLLKDVAKRKIDIELTQRLGDDLGRGEVE